MPIQSNLPLDNPEDLVRPPMVYVHENPPWEYKVLSRPQNELPDSIELNAIGAEGWELTAVITAADQVVYYFKRLSQ